MMNYSNKPVNNKGALFNCPIATCKRKYKREEKLKQHIEKEHYYETRNSNDFKFDHNIRPQIYDSAASYIVELYEIRKCYENNIYYGELLSKFLNISITSISDIFPICVVINPKLLSGSLMSSL